ncbi:TonB-dependent receptor [Lujinxingia sediminis]|uniref:TonB-dependent receptor n=2 Tax=Lujinxingia sediminis TaxID=2480984 RepID=A0ABY0CNU8_9DELT|nr:TonB-dependent receptor [Lujinxingia sediminis]
MSLRDKEQLMTLDRMTAPGGLKRVVCALAWCAGVGVCVDLVPEAAAGEAERASGEVVSVSGVEGVEIIEVLASLAQASSEDEGESDDDEGGEDTLRGRTVVGDRSAREDARHPSGFVTRVRLGESVAASETLGASLEQVEGVQLSRASSPGQPAYVSVRGGSPRQLVVYLDGLRLSSPAGLGFDVGQLGVGGLASADVFRGGAAVVHGAGALTGSVQLNPRMPTPGVRASARLSAGSFGSAGAQAAFGVGGRRAGLRLHLGVRRSEGDFGFVDNQGIVQARRNNDHRRFGGGATGVLKVGDGGELRLTTLVEEGAGGSAGPSEFQRSFELARVDDHRRLASLRYTFEGERWQAHADLGAQDRAYRYENARGHMTLEHVEAHSRQQTVAATGGARLFAGAHLLNFSGELRAERYEAADGAATLGAERLNAALALSEEWLLAGDTLSLVGALRGEVLREQGSDSSMDSRVYAPVVPAIGAIWRAHPRLEARANLAKTFRAPHFDELYLSTEAVRGNPDLLPEEAVVVDAGLRLRLGPGANSKALELGAAYFHNAIGQMILFLPISAYVYQAQNLSGARAHGVEATLGWAPFGRVRLDGSYTLTRAYLTIDQGGIPAQLPHQPRHRAFLRATLDLGGLVSTETFRTFLSDARLQATARYRSRVQLDNFGSLQSPGALRLDLGGRASLGGGLSLGVEVQNVLNDRRAQDFLQRPLPGRAFFISLAVLAEGE